MGSGRFQVGWVGWGVKVKKRRSDAVATKKEVGGQGANTRVLEHHMVFILNPYLDEK